MPRPRPALGAAVIVALDDFTAENGATCIVPGSHKWGSNRQAKRSETVPVVMPAGSVAYFLGTTWHGGGGNSTDKSRQSVLVQYCQPYIRPIENQFLGVDPRKLDEIPEQIVDMMGYQLHNTFIGYVSVLWYDGVEHLTNCDIQVDGLSARHGAKRMIQWLQGPVDRNPQTFAHHVAKL